MFERHARISFLFNMFYLKTVAFIFLKCEDSQCSSQSLLYAELLCKSIESFLKNITLNVFVIK